MKRRAIIKALVISIVLTLLLAAAPQGFPAFADPEEQPEQTGEDAGNDPAKEEPEPIDYRQFAKNIALCCIDTETVLYLKGENDRISPLAGSKLLTALVAAELAPDLSQTVEVTSEMLKSVSGLIYGFKAGNTVSYEDLIAAMLIRNANDAAVILSRALAKDTEDFVKLMNGKAKALGMNDSYFANPTGIAGDSYTTIRDLLTLTKAFAENDRLLSLSGSQSLKLRSTGVTIHSRNFFLSKYYNGGKSYVNKDVTGGISGQDENYGDLLITVMKQGGYTYACAVAGASRDGEEVYCYPLTADIVKWGEESFEYRTLLASSDVICNIPVIMGNGADDAGVFPAEKVTRYILKDIDLTEAVRYEYQLEEKELTAPVSYSQKVGRLTLFLDGEEICTVDLIVRTDIQSSSGEYMFSRFVAFITDRRFITVSVVTVSGVLIYVITMSIVRGQKQKRAMKREKAMKSSRESQG